MLHSVAVPFEGLFFLLRLACVWICSQLYHIFVAIRNEYPSKTDEHEGSDVQLLEMTKRMLFLVAETAEEVRPRALATRARGTRVLAPHADGRNSDSHWHVD